MSNPNRGSERKEMTILKFRKLLEYLAKNFELKELAGRPITMYDLKKMGAVGSVKEGGIKLLGDVGRQN
jgi:translation initiation factor 1 (eIF-1/SUI1)